MSVPFEEASPGTCPLRDFISAVDGGADIASFAPVRGPHQCSGDLRDCHELRAGAVPARTPGALGTRATRGMWRGSTRWAGQGRRESVGPPQLVLLTPLGRALG